MKLKKELRKRRVAAALAAAVAAVGVIPIASMPVQTVLAVTGSEVAQDGSYRSVVTAAKYKKGKLDKTYTGYLTLTVSDGKISGLSISADKQDRFDELLNSVRYNYIGKPATSEAAASAVDAVSSATAKGSQSGYLGEKYYTSDLTDVIESIIRSAPANENTSDNTPEAASQVSDGVYNGRSDDMNNGHYISLDVTVSNGKISGISIKEADGNWDNLLDTVKSSYIGQNAAGSNVDAVTTATQQGYRAAIAQAVKNALGSTAADDDNDDNKDDNTGGSTDATPTDSDGYAIVKKLKKAAKGVAAPEAEFTFTLSPRDVAPAISSKSISVSEGSSLSDLTADLSLTDEDIEKFTEPGIYEYILTEEESGLSSSAKGNMSYNTGKRSYLVRYKLWYNNGKLEPAAITVHEITDGVPADEKTQTPEFENCYTVESQLSVSKTVTGAHADKNRKFEYSVSFTKDEVNEGLVLLSDADLKKNGVTVAAGESLEYDTDYTFELSDGETVLFTVPAGTDYELTESAADNYTPSVNVVADGRSAAKTGKTGELLTLKAYVGENENKADFTNEYVDNPLTGITNGRGPLFIVIPAAAGAVVLMAFAVKRRKAL